MRKHGNCGTGINQKTLFGRLALQINQAAEGIELPTAATQFSDHEQGTLHLCAFFPYLLW